MFAVCSCQKKMHYDKRRVKEKSGVLAKNVEGMRSKKNEKGKGKEKEGGEKWKRDEEEDKEEEEKVEEGIELKASWRSLMTTWMVVMSMALDKLSVENIGLQRELREMRTETEGSFSGCDRSVKGYKDNGEVDEKNNGVD